ncbi:hypothetical protein IAU60_001099 [Kwoniella sp. DSM 27419]
MVLLNQSSHIHLAPVFHLGRSGARPPGYSWGSDPAIAVPLGDDSQLAVPCEQKTTHITIGRGVQNYTCADGAYVSAGALANLYDVSCLFTLGSQWFSAEQIGEAVPTLLLSAMDYPDQSNLTASIKHYFVETPSAQQPGAISPKFASDIDFVTVKKTANASAPIDPAKNVPWLQLTALDNQGTLSKTVFRLNTAGGQPPANCSNDGEAVSVQYSAMYWFTA